jgi:hypothetical protein
MVHRVHGAFIIHRVQACSELMFLPKVVQADLLHLGWKLMFACLIQIMSKYEYKHI